MIIDRNCSYMNSVDRCYEMLLIIHETCLTSNISWSLHSGHNLSFSMFMAQRIWHNWRIFNTKLLLSEACDLVFVQTLLATFYRFAIFQDSAVCSVIRVIIVPRVIRAIRVFRITSVKPSKGIIAHQSHISQVNANAHSVSEWVTL